MSLRILRIELKRSVAPWSGVTVLVTALALLYLAGVARGTGTTAWTAQWTSLALWTRSLLAYLWPLAMGFGALQGLRDHRSKMSELLTSTPRPARHRAATLTGATALTLASAFALLVLVGGVQVLTNTEYAHLGWLPISLVGALSLVAAAVLGMGAGRALPSTLTPPALAMGAFVFTSLMYMSLGRTTTYTASGIPTTEPNQLSLLSPAVEQVRDVLLTLSAPVHVGQTVWLLGMATTGFALLIAATRRARLIALTPVLAGAVIALLVLPSDPRRMYVVDEAAAELVCDGPVCVTRTQQARLPDFADHGKEALRLLHGALGGRAPVSIRENAAVPPVGSTPHWSREKVLVDFDDDVIAAAQGKDLTRALIATAMVPGCSPLGLATVSANDTAARIIAAGWVLGDPKPLGAISLATRHFMALADPVWKELKALPRAEQLSRINAMHAAAISCKGDPFEVLSGGASR
ncbi:ABC transporter permease [Streptomyces graminilatus]|uniref:ABC transporter permease n=1 Tax=Streptomyces graminilatus TaxID=1464070 RepID=UPI0006E18440|nr:ABC transporter permease [Streptomyces graminilatus]